MSRVAEAEYDRNRAALGMCNLVLAEIIHVHTGRIFPHSGINQCPEDAQTHPCVTYRIATRLDGGK